MPKPVSSSSVSVGAVAIFQRMDVEEKGYPDFSLDDGYFATEEEAEREWLRREVGQIDRP